MAKKVIPVIVLLVVAVVGYLNKDRVMGYFREDYRTINTAEVKLLFREDPTLEELAAKLQEEGVVKNAKEIIDYVAENDLPTDQFAAGKYIVLSGTQRSDLVKGFIKNDEGNGAAEVKVNVVFNRCRTIEDVGSNISKCILADSASIVEFIYADQTLQKYHFTREQVPALFLPATYELYFDTDAEQFVQFMADQFKAFWTENRKQKISDIGLQFPSEVVTLASIVYSEQSKDDSEWPIIAGLYLNRIRKGMKLESDPTFKFCWGDKLDGVERLLNKHKKIDCPYNTYLYSGLPPGPICVPPAEVIDAVLNPTKTDYIFMCGKPGGTGHNFAVTNREHEKNVAIYKKWLKEYLAQKNNG